MGWEGTRRRRGAARAVLVVASIGLAACGADGASGPEVTAPGSLIGAAVTTTTAPVGGAPTAPGASPTTTAPAGASPTTVPTSAGRPTVPPTGAGAPSATPAPSTPPTTPPASLPIPPGCAPDPMVAAGDGGAARFVYRCPGSSATDLHAFLLGELPRRGWSVQEPAPKAGDAGSTGSGTPQLIQAEGPDGRWTIGYADGRLVVARGG